MFTGLIEAICIVKSAYQSGGAMILTIDLGKLVSEVKIGDSISVAGVCLTVSKLQGTLATFDVSDETLKKSNLSKLKPSSQVNTELALKATDRLGGHFVTGHIDGAAAIKQIERKGQFAYIKFAAAPELLNQLVIKGSVAVDGISLTIADTDQSGFGVAIIPQTLEKTTLGSAKVGDTVNIETDIIVKTIKKHLEKLLQQKENLTIDGLKSLGF